MQELQIFNNEEFGQVRTVEIDGKPYFVANDVARALGYATPKDAVTRHCKGGVETSLPYGRRKTGDENDSRRRYVSSYYSQQIGVSRTI